MKLAGSNICGIGLLQQQTYQYIHVKYKNR